MTTRYFCTLFDTGYLLKGLVMLSSLSRFCPSAKVYVLCMDHQTKFILERLNLPFVTCITLDVIETEELLNAKSDRSVAEYCWTLSSCVTWYVMQTHHEIDFLTYIDADLFFYSSVQPLFDEIGDASIAIIEHRFTDRLKDREVNGRFCVEWVSFRRDVHDLACLSRWREQCIEWCYYRLEDGKMGDQKYLDEWPIRYTTCHILEHLGAGVAPWNYAQYSFGHDGSGNITVNGKALLFYHFHQFQLLDDGEFERLSQFYTSDCAEPISIYEACEADLLKRLVEVRSIVPNFKGGLKSAVRLRVRRFIRWFLPMWVKEIARPFMR